MYTALKKVHFRQNKLVVQALELQEKGVDESKGGFVLMHFKLSASSVSSRTRLESEEGNLHSNKPSFQADRWRYRPAVL